MLHVAYDLQFAIMDVLLTFLTLLTLSRRQLKSQEGIYYQKGINLA